MKHIPDRDPPPAPINAIFDRHSYLCLHIKYKCVYFSFVFTMWLQRTSGMVRPRPKSLGV
nr:hypothetical protein [Enterobacter sp. 10-1]